MSQVLANPESSSPPKNNYPLKVDTSKLISLSAKITDIIDILNKCHTDPRFINNDYLTFLFVTLNVQDIHYLFSKILHIFGHFIFWSAHVLVIRKYRLTTSRNQRPLLPESSEKGAKSKSIKEGGYFQNFFCLPVICNCDDNIFFYFTTIMVKSRLLLI